MSKIEWTEKTWNPMHGCTKCSPGCDNCYAERMANRQKHMGTKGYEDGFAVTLRPDRLDQPLKNKKPTVYFVCSMGDLYHNDVPDDFIDKVYAVAALCSHHTFLFLTKNAKRMAEYWSCNYRFAMIEGNAQAIEAERSGADPSLWLAVHDLPNVVNMITVCNQKEADEKTPDLLRVPGRRGLSIEPMLGAIDLTACFWVDGSDNIASHTLSGQELPKSIHQVILGGESGPGARPMHPDWARGVRDQCAAAGVPFMFKQWGEWMHGSNFSKEEKIIWPCGQLTGATKEEVEEAVLVGGLDGGEKVCRVGKKKAGRTLDGEIHNELIWGAK